VKGGRYRGVSAALDRAHGRVARAGGVIATKPAGGIGGIRDDADADLAAGDRVRVGRSVAVLDDDAEEPGAM
jgi:hypothetical protein